MADDPHQPEPPAPDPAATQRIGPVAPLPDGDHPDEGARWTARAGVPQAGVPRPDVAEEEWVPVKEPGGAWWLPLVLGVGGLLLLALVGIGVWLALRHSGNAPAPAASQSASVTLSPSPTPSHSLPPTPSPSQAPSASPSAVNALLPELRGTSVGDAQQTLAGLGLTSTVRYQVDGTVPAGTVLSTDPPAGATVPAGSSVVLVVAVAPTTSSPLPPSRSPSPTPTSNG